MDTSDWAFLQSETGTMISAGLSLPLLPSAQDPRHCSTSCQIHPAMSSYTGEFALHYKTQADQSYVVKRPTPLHRSRNASGKADIRKSSGGEAKLEVVFQKLNDAKKGIPDDGHRGWKKYGNKSIQNSNHCRGYYKCSAKQCRAKKMVQPTDKDPTLFEVTYVGKHSCSSTDPRRRSATATLGATPAGNNPATVAVPEGQRKKEKNARMKAEEDCRVLTAATVPTTVPTVPIIPTTLPTVLTSGTLEAEECIRETGWTGIMPGKRRRSLVEGKKAKFDSFSDLQTLTTSTTASVSEEQGGSVGDGFVDSYLHHSSGHHHQALFCFQEPLLWHEFDVDTSLATGNVVSMDSDSGAVHTSDL